MAKKNKLPPFVAIYRELLKDKEWRALSSSAKVVYIYLRSKFNARTLSEVTLAYSEMKDMMSTATMSNALKELRAKNFIKKEKLGGLFGGCCTYKFTGKHAMFHYKGTKV